MVDVPSLVLARHGQTERNLIGRRQGQLDSPLTTTGIAVARSLAEVLAGQGIDVILCSPLGRAQQTASIFAEALDVPMLLIEPLAEVHHGEFAGLSNKEIELRYPQEWAARDLDFYR